MWGCVVKENHSGQLIITMACLALRERETKTLAFAVRQLVRTKQILHRSRRDEEDDSVVKMSLMPTSRTCQDDVPSSSTQMWQPANEVDSHSRSQVSAKSVSTLLNRKGAQQLID
ncbi:unnamed protein product [Sympodiomycopsis kandeliae]